MLELRLGNDHMATLAQKIDRNLQTHKLAQMRDALAHAQKGAKHYFMLVVHKNEQLQAKKKQLKQAQRRVKELEAVLEEIRLDYRSAGYIHKLAHTTLYGSQSQSEGVKRG